MLRFPFGSGGRRWSLRLLAVVASLLLFLPLPPLSTTIPNSEWPSFLTTPSWRSWRKQESESVYVAEYLRVTVVHYSSTRDQTDDSPFVGRCGRVGPGTVAVSQDLLRRGIDCGTKVLVGGRTYVVRDAMHHRWRKRVDIWLPSRAAALKAGVHRNVPLEVVR